MTTSIRPDTTELGDARRRVEKLVCSLPGAPDGDIAFASPWEIRAFAIAVAAYDARQFEWSEFQLSLIDSITYWEENEGELERGSWSYYEHWLNALETRLSGSGLLSDADLDERTKTVLATPPDRDHHTAHLEPISIDPARTL
ncbi:nitrile hydratase accessory protein [Rhodococcus sp. 06-462-5]|uniref:nitrile hydratase accessory protein n=1 Tax=Nocardiaceae TaxID=85025 RepID=UPI00050CB05E|nr:MULTISPECIES: nitrile hydratase accessory protein [Rhodococcus]OZC73950.1 nitrile hydratase accessory protein [Rhodococcus sp. 06-462-5]OZE67946.1 nitrile hydratase accessory protein [Rhodococcus sp. 02-925g]OZF52033.1 nitrile hydratase accessory protein [Rhodococcus sp. 14-1411-2a]